MSATDLTSEELTKAAQGAEMLTRDLRSAMSTASALESLALLALIEKAAELSRGIAQLQAARVQAQ